MRPLAAFLRLPLAAFLRPAAAFFLLDFFLVALFFVAFFLAAFFVVTFFFPTLRTAFFLAVFFFAARFAIFLRGPGLFFVVRFFAVFLVPALPALRLVFALAFRLAVFLAAICIFPRELICKHHFRQFETRHIVTENSTEVQPGGYGTINVRDRPHSDTTGTLRATSRSDGDFVANPDCWSEDCFYVSGPTFFSASNSASRTLATVPLPSIRT